MVGTFNAAATPNANGKFIVPACGLVVYCDGYDCVDGRKIVVSRAVKEFEDLLMDKGFYRIHKSYIINIDLVEYFDKAEGGYVVMIDGASIPVASRKRELLFNLFNTLA